MRYQVSFFILIIIIGLVSINSVQGASAPSVPSVSVSNTAAYPYDAEITGDSVYVRTGAGTAFYEFGKLYKGDKVKIMGDMDGVWAKIQPLEGSFSWIAEEFVTPSSSDPSIGEVTGDNVRVWAGSPLYSPERSTTLQGRLSKGSKVKIIGAPVNKYYKIAVPSLPDAYYWVSTQYTKPIPREVTPVVDPLSMLPSQPGTTGTVGPTNPITIPGIPEASGVENVVDSNAVAIAEVALEPTPLELYYELQQQMEEERAKPLSEQDYSSIKESLLEVINDKDAGKASIFSQAILDRIKGIELALEVEDLVKQQNDKFKENKEKIEKAYTKKLEEVQNLGKYAVIGKLQNSTAYGTDNYRIVDDSDQNICYAVPTKSISGISGMIGKKVGLVGTIETSVSRKGAVVNFSAVELID